MTRLRREVRAFIELFALCGFAIAQPLLDIFGRAITQLSFRGASGRDVVLFGIGLTFLPALGLWCLEAIVGLGPQKVRRVLHLLFVGGLVVVFTIQAARPLASGAPLFLLAAACGAGAAALYVRAAPARQWLSFAAVAPVAFLGLFLVSSPASKLIGDAAFSSSGAAVGAPAPVVVLLLDELPLASLVDRDGEIDAELYPNLAELAETSHWFRNTTTLTGATFHAVPTIVTGQIPDESTWPVVADHPENIFTLLGGAMDFNVTETVTRLCPASLCTVADQPSDPLRELGRDALDILGDRLAYGHAADDPVAGFAEEAPPDRDEIFEGLSISQPTRFDALLDGIVDDRPALHYLHILLPHVPYEYLPSGGRYQGPVPDIGRLEQDQWGEEVWPTTLGRQRHVLQASYADRLLGELLDTLRERGLFDDAMVVVVADHGISFGADGPIRGIEGQRLDEGEQADIMWIPFFVKEPGQTEGVVSDANVLSLDVLPTIADVLDIDIPWEVDGQSALGPPRTDPTKPNYGADVGPFGASLAAPIDVEASLDDVLERSVDELFPPAGTDDRVWRIGPYDELVGEPVEDVAPGRLTPVEAVLRGADAFDDVDEDDFLPVLVRGRVEGLAHGDVVAVAVNGEVAATGPIFTDGDGLAFAVMIDDARLRPGRNEVTVHRVER